MRVKLLATLMPLALTSLNSQVAIAQTPVPAPVVVPQVRVELPPIHVNTPLVNLDLPDIYVNVPDMVLDGGDWFDDEWQTPEREELHQTYQLSAGAHVEISDIDGPIEIETTDGNTADVKIISYSSNNSGHKLTIENTPSMLSVRGNASSINMGEGQRHRVALKLPRRIDLTINHARDSVRVDEIDGPIKLNGVSGRVSVAQASGSADVSDVSGSVNLFMSQIGGRGVRISNVSGKVTLRFMDELNANLQTQGIKGKVYVELPNVSVEGEMSRTDFRARVGTGGAPVNISDVSGSVRLARAASVPEMINILKTSAERRPTRMETARDLALHVSNRAVRQALLEALNNDQNDVVRMTAVRALEPYVTEPEVRESFMRALENSRNDVVRMTAVRAIAHNYASEKSVRDVLLRVFASDKSDVVRMTIAGALSKYVDDPSVMRMFIDALKNDKNEVVRVRAASALATRVDNNEVYVLLLDAAKNDRKSIVRAHALDGLSSKIKERPELRNLFLSYLDDESVYLQYHALKGLVALGDSSLKAKLVDKSKEIITTQSRRHWNDLVLDTLLLLRKLDPQEADKMMEQIGSERSRSY